MVASAPGLHAQPAPEWQPEQPPLSTPWTDEVGPNNALPKYPRPQLAREKWKNLNGVWQYAAGSTPPARDAELDERILVPYPPESALSGIKRHDEHMLYRRTFKVPPDWRGQRLLLHLGAVDQEATVWVNGHEVARHGGGFTRFTVDVTDALKPGRKQQVTVAAEDRNEGNPYPVGKQTNKPGGIFYTGSSGIWQTVWIEPVSTAHIRHLDITPNLDTSSFALTAHTRGVRGQRVEAIVSEPGGREVSRTVGPADSPLSLPVPEAHLWSPKDPYLYDLTVRLIDGSGRAVDEVTSYQGMRSIGLVEDARGRPRMALNGEILFQQGMLDQGYWPDGLYTPPTDEAMRFDIKQAKQLGFNMLRKHIKVAPARWYYWADRMGMLVWQDMPSLTAQVGGEPGPPVSAEAKANYEAGLTDMVEQLDSTTSIVSWVTFNEGWGEFDTARLAERVERMDPSRLVNASSGVNCCNSLPDTGAGDVYDDHTYVGPGNPEVTGDRAAVDGEYGGLGLIEQGHLWPGDPSAYEMTDSRAELTRRYAELSDELTGVIRRQGLSAAIYTQVSDVENEVNGLMTYDRRITKPDVAAVRASNEAIIDVGTP
ncbi:beta-galactosidase/beta-glucuronidase [Saccharopolyspora lacisalsi]|uniref:Beta-galactosidase/beta-glucuronidase n=1 Tax=Halosaccharopolyspora lacisalsi TaxID=1000566 RepID=A0A839DTM4_9PSEU|nr:sugar-binding domain-containing protein [Halosaccharopolyspora lacisalsi]MBA8824393.1 beta-galactosidase/beta-glucuronidase [Halosaccharopolyspora lacisalsi]